MQKKLQNKKLPIYGGLILIMLLGLAVRLKYFVGLNYGDDMAYSHLAARLVYDGTWFMMFNSFVDNYCIKIGMWYPIALFYKFLGVSQFSLGLYPLICSLANMVLIYFMGAILFNPVTGLIASFLLSIYPLDVFYATWATPDVPLSFFQALSALLIIYKPSDKNINWILKLGAGLIWGFSSSINASSNIFLFGIIGVYLARVMIREKTMAVAAQEFLWLLSGFLIYLAGEGYFFLKNTGNILFKYSETLAHYGGLQGATFGRVDFLLYPKAMFLLKMPDGSWSEYGMYFYLFILAIGFFLFRRKAEEKKVLIPILWALLYFLYLQFGSMSPTKYVAMHRLPRHLSVLSVPLILVGALFLQKLLDNGKLKKLFFFSLLIILFISSLFFIHDRYAGYKLYRDSTQILVEKLNRLGTDQRAFFFIHRQLGAELDFTAKYKGYPYQAWSIIDQCPDFNAIYFLKYQHIYFIMDDSNRYRILNQLRAADIKVEMVETIKLNQNYYLYYAKLE